MKRLISLMAVIVLMTGILSACGGIGGVKQGTAEECAKTFIQAMIDGDEKTLNQINKSDPMLFPTNTLLSQASRYQTYKLSDFSFSTDESRGIVTVKSSDGKIKDKLEIKKANDKYYFFTYD